MVSAGWKPGLPGRPGRPRRAVGPCGRLAGYRFRLEAVAEGVRVTAVMPGTTDPAVWVVWGQ
jgi:hypothetical protein